MKLDPQLALVVYGSPMNREHLLSLHGITKGPDGHPTLDAGRLLGPTDARELAGLLCGKEERRMTPELFPEVLLHADDESMTWYRPPAMSIQHWRTPQGRTTITAVLPGLVFHAGHRLLYVAAYADNGRPGRQSKLYHAPLGNVYARTDVCLGNVRVPDAPKPSNITAWERVLLDSNYTHLNHENVLRGTATTEALMAFWLRRQRARTPPAERSLAPLNRTLGSWLQDVSRHTREQAAAEDFD